MARPNKKSHIPNKIKVGDIYSFVKRGDTTIVGWLGSQLPKGFHVVRTVVRHSNRPAGKYSLTLAVERKADGKRAGIFVGEFYTPDYLPSKYPRILAREAKRRLEFLDYLGEVERA